jgi:signal transduction histidine kinase
LRYADGLSHAAIVVGLRGSTLRKWGIAFAAWSAVGLFAIGDGAWRARLDGHDPSWRIAAAWMLNMWLWAVFTPSMLWWSRRLPMERRRWPRNVVAHVALSLAYSAASTAFNLGFAELTREPIPGRLASVYLGELFDNVLSYAAIAMLAHALAYARQLTCRRMRAALLEHELTRAQLAALEMQLRPHFLFNTLHSVAGLVRAGQPEAAIEMIGGLGDLLRIVLDEDRAQELALADELALAERYLAIERIRFADRLRVAFDIAPAARDALVPRLILQPLLENAIRHGVQAHEDGGAVTVRAACRGGALELEVIDAGPRGGQGDRAARRGAGHGIGLQNTRDRLRHLYGEAQRLELEPWLGGTVVRVVLPLRRAPEAA